MCVKNDYRDSNVCDSLFPGANWYPWALHQVDFPILSLETCVERHRKLGHPLEMTSEHICAGNDGDKGVCNVSFEGEDTREVKLIWVVQRGRRRVSLFGE